MSDKEIHVETSSPKKTQKQRLVQNMEGDNEVKKKLYFKDCYQQELKEHQQLK
jgi:hypothetical protein